MYELLLKILIMIKGLKVKLLNNNNNQDEDNISNKSVFKMYWDWSINFVQNSLFSIQQTSVSFLLVKASLKVLF